MLLEVREEGTLMLPTSEEEEVPDGVGESKISLKTKEKTGTQTHVIGVV